MSGFGFQVSGVVKLAMSELPRTEAQNLSAVPQFEATTTGGGLDGVQLKPCFFCQR